MVKACALTVRRCVLRPELRGINAVGQCSPRRAASSSNTRSLEWRQIPGSSQCHERARVQQDRNRVAPSCQIGTYEWSRTVKTVRNKPHSAPANQVMVTKDQWMLPSVIAAKSRIVDMIRHAAAAGFLPVEHLSARLYTPVEAASAAFLDALDDTGNPTAML